MYESAVKLAGDSQLAGKRSQGLLSKLLQPLVRGLPRSGHLPGGNHAALDVACRAAAVDAALAGQAASPLARTNEALGGVSSSTGLSVIDMGFPRNLEENYLIWRELGRGGNGVVKLVTDRKTGQEYACKCIKKELPSTASEHKRRHHIDSIVREISVLRQLKGSLNVVELRDVFEDDENIYIVMERLQGGELWHRIGDRHYSERTVASFMRAVFRTLAQCHSHHILHRDIKPGNFMLANGDDRSPLKAIDFGLAVPYEPDQLPRSDLGLEGTPWYIAPEVLSSQVTPAADIWAAGVMAFQLLTGRFPFDDRRNPVNPSVSAIFKAVLTEELDFSKPWWDGISEEARELVRLCLDKDPARRPSAKQALQHPWLQGTSAERSTGKPIASQVVQRIQRYAQNSVFKRSVLQSIARELLDSSPSAFQQLACPADSGSGSDGSRPVLAAACNSPLNAILALLHMDGKEQATFVEVSEALLRLGYKLAPSELRRLLEQVDISQRGMVRRSAVAASQVDWAWLQRNQVDIWVDIAGRAFAELDKDNDGVVRAPEILETLRSKLPESELKLALQQAMQEAGEPDAEGLDFQGFLNMLRIASLDSLDQYDDRLSRASLGSYDASYRGRLANAASAASLARSDSLASVSEAGDAASEAGSGLPLDMSMHSVLASPSGSVHGGAGNGSVRRAQRPRAAGGASVPGSPGLRGRRSLDTASCDSLGHHSMLPSPGRHAARAFNFDVGPAPRPSPPQHKATVAQQQQPAAPLAKQPSFKFDVGPGTWQQQQQQVSPFNFDIATGSSRATQAAAVPHTGGFRFDVGPEELETPRLARCSFKSDVGPGSLAAPEQQEQDRRAISQLASNIVALDPRKAERVRGGCHSENRMHGGNLYRTLHAQGGGLPTVAE